MNNGKLTDYALGSLKEPVCRPVPPYPLWTRVPIILPML